MKSFRTSSISDTIRDIDGSTGREISDFKRVGSGAGLPAVFSEASACWTSRRREPLNMGPRAAPRFLFLTPPTDRWSMRIKSITAVRERKANIRASAISDRSPWDAFLRHVPALLGSSHGHVSSFPARAFYLVGEYPDIIQRSPLQFVQCGGENHDKKTGKRNQPTKFRPFCPGATDGGLPLRNRGGRGRAPEREGERGLGWA